MRISLTPFLLASSSAFYSSADDDFITLHSCTSFACSDPASYTSNTASSTTGTVVVSHSGEVVNRKLTKTWSGRMLTSVCDGISGGGDWTCAVLGATSGKAVSGCSMTGSPKGTGGVGEGDDDHGHVTGEPSDDIACNAANADTPGCRRRTTTTPATCPYLGTATGRLDSGSSNPNYKGLTAGISLMMKDECVDEYGAGYEPYVSEGGGDFKKGQLIMDCNNPGDVTSKVIVYVCCNSACDCKDPVIQAGTNAGADIALGPSSLASSSSSTATVAVVASAAAVFAVGVGVAAVAAMNRRASEEEALHAVLQQDEINEL